MKLIFLGDSFTEGVGIDIEYGIKINLFPDNDSSYFINKRELIKFEVINEFRRNNLWTKLLCNELKVIEENLSLSASGLDSIFLELIQSEKINYNNQRCYIICLPFLDGGRFIVENELNKNKSISNLFSKVMLNFNLPDNDLFFYKNNFNENYCKLIYLQSLISIINYLKNKKIKFLILPTWHNSIKEHFFNNKYDKNNKKENYFYDFFEKFIFNEIEDQMNFNIDINKIKKLPCGHPNIESQKIIKNMYIEYIKNKLH